MVGLLSLGNCKKLTKFYGIGIVRDHGRHTRVPFPDRLQPGVSVVAVYRRVDSANARYLHGSEGVLRVRPLDLKVQCTVGVSGPEPEYGTAVIEHLGIHRTIGIEPEARAAATAVGLGGQHQIRERDLYHACQRRVGSGPVDDKRVGNEWYKRMLDNGDNARRWEFQGGYHRVGISPSLGESLGRLPPLDLKGQRLPQCEVVAHLLSCRLLCSSTSRGVIGVPIGFWAGGG